MVACPLCNRPVKESLINEHIDANCESHILSPEAAPSTQKPHNFFSTPARRTNGSSAKNGVTAPPQAPATTQHVEHPKTPPPGTKRSLEESGVGRTDGVSRSPVASKRTRVTALQKVAPLAERMRPTSLDDVCGQEIVGPKGVLRGMIETNTLPSIILWGGPGTGKTTIARLIANTSGARFVEINSTSTGVAEVKKIFMEALGELTLTGRKTIIFCDEIHRFSKAQQDVFLGPVEAGQVTLIAATTENPSFKIINALMSRCRTFTLAPLSEDNLLNILNRAMEAENCTSPLLDEGMLRYFASFADGDARTALNLLDLAINLSKRESTTAEDIKRDMTKTLVYDRNGDQHYDNISALHKSIRGSNADASLYYLGRMLQSGEDPLYVARRLVVVASEDVGLADNTMLPLAIATYTACEKVGMPECRINLAHCVVALSLSPKSTRSYRGIGNVMAALKEPGIAGLPVPLHLRNAPTRLMKEMGYGNEYKYNPHYLDGRVSQMYLPEEIKDRKFLEDLDLGTKIDEDLVETDDTLLPEIDD